MAHDRNRDSDTPRRAWFEFAREIVTDRHHRAARVRSASSATLGLLLLITAACASSPTSSTVQGVSEKPTLLVYGDSLAVQSEQDAQLLYGHEYRIVFRAAGGTSLCDWVPDAAQDKAIYRPSRVVLAFTGNTASCAARDFIEKGANGWLENYRRALIAMRSTYPTTPVSVVASPAMAPQPKGSWYPENGNPALNYMFKLLCVKYGLNYNDVADNTLSPGHRFVWQQHAFPGNGPMVATRAPDGVHLLPPGQLYYAAALGR